MKTIKPSGKVVFSDDSLEQAFNSLPENDEIKKAIRRTIENLKTNAFCGEAIRKELIPQEYISKYKINNLYWYPLPNGWRLVYSLMNNEEVGILAVIIEYFDHKSYERKFGY
jgi:Txe/YoeB family toxin of Txe-Axe toxin-antitoxin module